MIISISTRYWKLKLYEGYIHRIVLCVDNAEVNSKKQQQLLQELEKNGVQHDVRKLQVRCFIATIQTSFTKTLHYF